MRTTIFTTVFLIFYTVFACNEIPEKNTPFKPTWESIVTNYRVPEWFRDGKFGIFLHWGIYSVPAMQSVLGLRIELPNRKPDQNIIGFKIAGAKMDSPILKFDFGSGQVKEGFTKVEPQDQYSPKKGYGLVCAGEIKNAGSPKYPSESDGITATQPFYFEVDLPEGNYKIQLTLGGQMAKSLTTVKAESRRLMLEKVKTNAGQTTVKTIMVNVRTPRIDDKDSIRRKPREMTYLNWDNKLTLEFSDGASYLNAIEITKTNSSKVVFLAGNSTVVDQENEPYASWGQMIPRFFGTDITVANFAESGEALKSFKNENRLKKIKHLMKQGDYLFIEFAHNDQKPGSAHVDPFTTYKEELKDFIAVAHERGGIPVLVTSMHRRKFDDNGKIINTLGDYPEAMRQTAIEENVALIDLNSMSKVLYEAMGIEGSLKALVHFPANTFANQPNALADNTHFTNYGAYQLAKCMVEGIKSQVPELSKHLLDDLETFDPSQPDPWDEWTFPSSPAINPTKPAGN